MILSNVSAEAGVGKAKSPSNSTNDVSVVLTRLQFIPSPYKVRIESPKNLLCELESKVDSDRVSQNPFNNLRNDEAPYLSNLACTGAEKMKRALVISLAVVLAAPPIASVAVLSVTAPVVLGPAFAMALGAFGLWLGIRKKNANPRNSSKRKRGDCSD